MSHNRVLIARVDDPASDQMTDLAAFDLPTGDVSALDPEAALDELETTSQEAATAMLRRTLQATVISHRPVSHPALPLARRQSPAPAPSPVPLPMLPPTLPRLAEHVRR